MAEAIFPGTFDPVTIGHLDIVERGLKIFDGLLVAVAAVQHQKPELFPVEERIEMFREAVAGLDGVEVVSFSGLLVDFAREQEIHTIVRGLRVLSDFEYEFQMALMNRKLADSVETVFLMPSEEHVCLTSTVVKEITRLGGPIDGLVPPGVARRLGRLAAAGKV